MQNDTATLTDYIPGKAIVEHCSEIQQANEDAEPAWLSLSRRMQEPIVWPRVFPGL